MSFVATKCSRINIEEVKMIKNETKDIDDKVKNIVIKARVSKTLQQKLDFCSKKLCVSKSDIIRKCIESLYSQTYKGLNK